MAPPVDRGRERDLLLPREAGDAGVPARFEEDRLGRVGRGGSTGDVGRVERNAHAPHLAACADGAGASEEDDRRRGDLRPAQKARASSAGLVLRALELVLPLRVVRVLEGLVEVRRAEG